MSSIKVVSESAADVVFDVEYFLPSGQSEPYALFIAAREYKNLVGGIALSEGMRTERLALSAAQLPSEFDEIFTSTLVIQIMRQGDRQSVVFNKVFDFEKKWVKS